MLRLAVFSVLVVCSSACCTPLVWEMDEGKIAARRGNGQLDLSLTNTRFHYDAINQRVAMTMGVFRDPNVRNTTIWDYEKKIMYIIDEIHETCEVRSISMEFQPICSPADGRQSGPFFYGGGDQAKLPAIMFEYDRPDYSGFAKVTEPGETCVPIITVDYNLSFMTFMSFENIKNGISDPSVFTPPEVCDQAIVRKLDPRIKPHPYLGVPLLSHLN